MKNQEIHKAAILGGTFDPVHNGHLLAAERVREEFGLDCVYFIPCGSPPHKNYKGMAFPIHRYNMVKRAVVSNPLFKVLDIETKRQGVSYTIDTVNQLIEILGEQCMLYFIIGSDNVADILNWKSAAELIQKVEFIIVTRPGEWEGRLKKEVESLEKNGCRANVLEIPLIPITSTDIRNRVKDGKTIRYMVHEEVRQYIINNKLYINS